MTDRIDLSEKIKDMARAHGIDALGFADASEFSGYALSHSIRRDPRLSLPDVETILVAGIYIGGVILPAWMDPWYGRTSRLYLSGYFSDVVQPLEPIAGYLRSKGYKAVICDGSAEGGSIIPLKLAAVRAGLGWQGKHSLLITKKFGSFLALGGIVTDAVLEHNSVMEPNWCRECNKCREACPVSALEQPHVLDRAKCLSHLLQNEGLPREAQRVVENRVGDCEICQQACPWNKKHLKKPLQTALTLSFREKVRAWEEIFHLPNLVEMTEAQYKEVFGCLNTGIPYGIFHRNVRMALERARESKTLQRIF